MENAYVDSNIDIGLTAGLSTLAVIIGGFLFVFLVILIVLYHTRKRKWIHEDDEWTIARFACLITRLYTQLHLI